MSGWLAEVIVQTFTVLVEHIFVMNLHEFDEFTNRVGCLWFKILVIFHGFELMVNLEDERDKLVFVCLLVFVELDDSSL